MSAILTKIINTVYIMKLVMTLLVRDEQDIIKENIDFHYAQGVDYFIVTDNLSVDKTPAILQDYVKKGIVHYLSQTDDNYHQCAWVTTMAQMAVKEFNADWVINNDADEFWWPKTGNLKQTFSNLAPEINTLQAQCYNFVAIETNNYTEAFYQYMIYREVMSLNPLGMPLPAKMAHKANEHIIV
ncbi:MAG: glycosyltransferase family 2 protein, partial [Methylococcaceae bacterium]